MRDDLQLGHCCTCLWSQYLAAELQSQGVIVIALCSCANITCLMLWAFCLQTMLKCADIGHLTSDLKTHKRWVSMLEEEFFIQVS